MGTLEEADVRCPWCGERIEIVVDDSVPSQTYVEDCAVCCRPIELRVTAEPDAPPEIVARRENE